MSSLRSYRDIVYVYRHVSRKILEGRIYLVKYGIFLYPIIERHMALFVAQRNDYFIFTLIKTKERLQSTVSIISI